MTSNTMPRWLVGLFAVVGVMVLGPPALVVLIIALGLLLKAGLLALKVAAISVGVLAAVFIFRALFGGRPQRRVEVESIDAIAARVEQQEQEQRLALDRQLAEAMERAR